MMGKPLHVHCSDLPENRTCPVDMTVSLERLLGMAIHQYTGENFDIICSGLLGDRALS